QSMMKRPDLMMFVDGGNLEKLIPAEDLAMVNAELTKRGMPLAAVKTIKPWMLTAMLATPACEAARKADGIEILDIHLATRAKAAGKTVAGLETMEEQMSAMASLPMKDHINGLVETLRLADFGDDAFETMLALYAQGNTARIMPALGAALQSITGDEAEADLEAQAAFEEKMITNRNTIMVQRLPEHLEKGGAFVAIGALHLPGELGVIQQLMDAGYQMEAVE
ncbi:MAG: TraB/GumN family protein, partial [Notoacmeibacter sp.]